MTDAYVRSKAIDALVNDDISTFEQYYHEGDFDLIGETFRFGHKGYDNFTDEEITKELEDRDISYLFGDDDDDYDGQPDEAQEWYDFDPDA